MKKILLVSFAITISSYSFCQSSKTNGSGETPAVGIKKNTIPLKESTSKTNAKVSSSEYYKVKETGEVLPIGVTPAEAERKRMAENAADGHKINDPAIIKRREEEMRQKKALKGINKEEK